MESSARRARPDDDVAGRLGEQNRSDSHPDPGQVARRPRSVIMGGSRADQLARLRPGVQRQPVRSRVAMTEGARSAGLSRSHTDRTPALTSTSSGQQARRREQIPALPSALTVLGESVTRRRAEARPMRRSERLARSSSGVTLCVRSARVRISAMARIGHHALPQQTCHLYHVMSYFRAWQRRSRFGSTMKLSALYEFWKQQV